MVFCWIFNIGIFDLKMFLYGHYGNLGIKNSFEPLFIC